MKVKTIIRVEKETCRIFMSEKTDEFSATHSSMAGTLSLSASGLVHPLDLYFYAETFVAQITKTKGAL